MGVRCLVLHALGYYRVYKGLLSIGGPLPPYPLPYSLNPPCPYRGRSLMVQGFISLVGGLPPGGAVGAWGMGIGGIEIGDQWNCMLYR